MHSPNRCLICYCQTEVITSSAEEKASLLPPPLNEVQTYHDDDGADAFQNLQSENKEGFDVTDCLSSSPPKNKLSKDLRAIFTLRKLLQVSQEELASHLSKWGSPGSWISLCSRCNKVVSNAQRIYHQILDATRVLEGMRGDIVGMIKESLDSEPSLSNEEIKGILEVTVKTRELVNGCEYVEQTICDPFISGDLKALDLLKLQEQERERFSNNSRNDEDHDFMEVDEGEGAEQSMQSCRILGSSNDATDVQSLFMTPPPSIQSPPKLSDCEVQEDNTEENSRALKAEEPAVVENQKMEQPAISPPDIKPSNTIQLSFNIPKLPVKKKDQVPAPAKSETSWMIDVRPNIFAKKSEEPTTISKSLESPVSEQLEGVVIPKEKAPDNRKEAVNSEMQTTHKKLKSEVQIIPSIEKQTIKLEPPDILEAAVEPEVSNVEVAIKQEAINPNSIEEAIENEVRNPNFMEQPIKPGAQPPENRKEAIEPKTNASANCFPQLPTTSKSKALPIPPRTEATTNNPSNSAMEDMLADLDPFVKELLSVPASKSKLPPKAKASMSLSTSSPPPISVKQPVQQVQTGQPNNNSGHHGFDKQILQENGTWRHYCRCGISYVNKVNLSRHITNMSKITVAPPRNAHPDTPQQYQCFICKFASPSVIAIFSNRNLLKNHLDQLHHTKIIATSATATNSNGAGSRPTQVDKSMELKRELSFIPIIRITEAESLPPPTKNNVVRPSPAPTPKLQQQPVQPKKFTSNSPITITTTAFMSSRSAQARTSTPKNIVVRPSPAPKLLHQQSVRPKNVRPSSPIIISTTAIRPSRSFLTKPPSPTKRPAKPRWYVCRHCLGANPPQTKRFTCLAHLTNHIHSEHGGWLCPTPNCGKIFSTWMHLIAHRRKLQCCVDNNVQILEPSPQAQAQVQVLQTSPITMPNLASRPKNTLDRYLQVTKVERKPVIKPRILVAENDDDVICIDD